jgi:hypothetical protein
MDAYEVFDIKIVVLESALHKDVTNFPAVETAKNFTKSINIL